MKIALYTSNRATIPPSPATVAASAYLTGLLADGLVGKGHQVDLYAPKGSKTKANLIHLNLPPHNLDFSLQKEEWVLKMSMGMKQIYLGELFKKDKEYDIIHLQTEPIYLGMPFANLSSSPTIFTNHNPFLLQELDILNYYKKLPIITISNYQRTTFPQLNYVSTVYNGIEIEKFPYYETEKNRGYIYFTGRLVPDKGVKEAIEAVKGTSKKLIISGIGRKEFIEEVIAPHISEKIEFTGPGMKETTAWFDAFGKAKLSLFPIQWEEPFGLTLIESMATGTPVIVFARGAAPEIVKDGFTGYLVNASDEDVRGNFTVKKTGIAGLQEAIERIYSLSASEYAKMRKAARKHVEDSFTVEKMVDGYIKTYNNILS